MPTYLFLSVYYLMPITYASRLVEIKMGNKLKTGVDKMWNLWYNAQLKGGNEVYDLDDLIFAEDYKVHSEK